MKRKINLKNNRGVAALLVVSAFALLFIALVIGLSAVSLREQKQAGDIDQTNRANALAEQGITDAFSILDNNPGYREPTCDSNRASNEAHGWTCRTITTTPGKVEGVLDKDESDIIRADKAEFENPDGTKTPVRYTTSFALEYCSKADVDAGGDCKPTPNPFSPANPYPPYSTLVRAPAVAELSLAYWRSPSDNLVANPEDIKVKTFVVDPDMKDQSPLHTVGALQSTCDNTPSANGYYCKIDVDTAGILGVSLADNKNYRAIVKLKARYSSSHYRLTFYNSDEIGGDHVAPVPATDFVVDVTAKSGNLYRRIIGRRKVAQTVSQGVFDNALFASGNICKNMSVNNDLSLATANTCE